MTTERKRQLLAELLAGKTEGIRAYQVKTQQKDANIRTVIDSRQCGGTIEILYRDYTKKEITSEEFDKLQETLKPTIWRIQDYTGGRPVRAPDEDYNLREED